MGDKVHTQAMKFVQRLYQRLRRPGKPVVAPDQHDIDLALPRSRQQRLILRTIVARTARIVDILTRRHEAPPGGILAQYQELRLRVLPEMSQAAPLLAVGGNATNKNQSRSDTAYGQVEAKRAMSA